MKLKQSPGDFHVEELTDVVPTSGPYALYRLEKTGWTTPSAIAAISKRLRIQLNRISFGGLKDRHALTSQFISVMNGPKRSMKLRGIALEYLGQLDRPYISADIAGNRFHIRLRQLTSDACHYALNRLNVVQLLGLPNYFDDQRFGSNSNSEFPARLMVLGHFEQALKLVLTAPYEFDKAPTKRLKRQLKDFWGNWEQCRELCRNSTDMAIFAHLYQRPNDFRGAVGRMRPELQGLYLAAYQSMIWNRMLAQYLFRNMSLDQLQSINLKTGPVPIPSTLDQSQLESLKSLDLPLPSARLKWDADASWAPLVEFALRDQGFSLVEMKLPGLRRPFFSKGNRAAWIRPTGLLATAKSDELHAGYQKIELSFELPRGAYATILTKVLTPSPADDTITERELSS